MCKVLIDNEEFATIEEAAKFLETRKWYLYKLLKEHNTVKVNGFDVKRMGRVRKFTKIICLETKEVFNSMTALSNHLGILSGTISNAFRDSDVFKYGNKSYCRLSEKSELSRAQRTRTINTTNYRRVTVMCKQTGEIFNSIKELATKLNVKGGTISNALIKDKIYRKGGLSYIKYIKEDKQTPAISYTDTVDKPVQHVLDIVIPNNQEPTKESAIEVIRKLACDNINSGQYYVSRVLIDVLEKLENKNVNNS